MQVNPSLYMDLYGVIILLIVNANARQYGKSALAKAHFALVNLALSVLVLEGVGWLLDGAAFPHAHEALTALNTAYYLLQIFYCGLWLRFTFVWFGKTDASRRALWWYAPLAVEAALILVNPWTGWIFSMTDENVYARGAYYTVNLIPYYFYILAAAVVNARYAARAKDGKTQKESGRFALYMVLPVIGMAIESVLYGVSWLWPMCSLSLLMIGNALRRRRLEEEFMRAQRAAEASARLKNELLQSQVSIMLSQIQPHFLYNALSTIRELCRIDPLTAERATIDFSNFLRGNMDSLSAAGPIPFDREIAHTRNYMALEKLRFGEYLSVEYDLKTTRFMLPTLTLQPIVENAVRYGVTKREEGGTVLISTWETDAAFMISVQDDGVGFDPMLPHPDGRTHVGIRNVSERLRRMCGGALVIESTPGVGTLATITLPKEGQIC